MAFWSTLVEQLKTALPVAIAFSLVAPIPYIIAEQIWPARTRPRWTDYLMNFGIAISTLVLSLPLGMLAAIAAAKLHQAIGWQPLSLPFDYLSAVPLVGPLLTGLFLMIAPLLLHDLWFYWSHRLEHRIPTLWAFHSLHHSDPHLNCMSANRDHFLQTAWRSFFSIFTLGLLIDLDMKNAGAAAMLSQMALMLWSMFYHSAIRVQLPWLDRVLVTPQVHRIHHSRDPRHFDRNFADIFPFMDILFGTYEKPVRGEFCDTGLDDPFLSPRSLAAAQINPLRRAFSIRKG